MSRAFRTLRRACQLKASGQWPLLRERIDPAWRRVLWIHEGMPQIGDALMDLAARSLLVEQGLVCDLYVAPHIASVFAGDRWFSAVISEASDVHADGYDAAIVLSHDRKALRLKRERLPKLPWVSLQKFYNGPDFHRARFSAQRLADLFGLGLTDEALDRHAMPKLAVQTDMSTLGRVALQRPYLVFCVGGVRQERTWHHWLPLLALLDSQPRLHRVAVVVLGGANGVADGALIEASRKGPTQNLAGRTSLLEAHAILARAGAVVCADGGLMHLAMTTSAPIVALFSGTIDPAWRVPLGRTDTVAIRASAGETVDTINPEQVVEALAKIWSAQPQGEHEDQARSRPKPSVRRVSDAGLPGLKSESP